MSREPVDHSTAAASEEDAAAAVVGPSDHTDRVPPAVVDVAEEQDLTKAATSGAAWLTVVNMVAKGSQIVVTLGLAAFLSTHDLGLVTITTSLLNIVALLQMMGVYDVIGRTRSDPQRFSGSVVTMSLLISGVSMAVGILLADVIAEALNAPGQGNLLRLAFLSLPFSAYGGVQNALMSRRMQFRLRAISEGLSSILGSAVTLALAWLGHGAFASVWGVLITSIGACTIAAALKVVIRPRLHVEDMKETISWAGVVGPAAVVGLVIMNTDYIVVARLRGQSDNGIYSLAFRIAYMPMIMIGAIVVGVGFQVFAELHRRDDWRGLTRAVTDFLSVSGVIIIGLYSIIFAMADHLDLLGTKWGPSVGPMRVLCLYGICLSVAMLLLDALRAAGEKGAYLVSQLVQLGVLLPTVIAFTHWFGIRGTAWAQVTAAASVLVFALFSVRHNLRIPVMRAVYALIGPLTGAMLVIAGYFVFDHFVGHSGPSLPMALASGVLFVGLYVGGVYLTDPSLIGRLLAFVRKRG